MRVPKKPPPDTVGNVLGRIHKLRLSVQGNVAADVRDGVDGARALAKYQKEAGPTLKKLRRRLELAHKAEGNSAPTSGSGAPKAAKQARGASEGDDDLLSKLDSL